MNSCRNRRHSHGGRRRGTSLLEMLVTMGVAVVVLGIAVTTIHLLLRAERHAGQAVWHNRTVSRLSRTLRADVHAARTAAIEPQADDRPAALALSLPDERRISYAIDEHQLTRVETVGEQEKHREEFFLPPGSTLRFEQTAGPPAVVRLVVLREPPSGRAPAGSKTTTGEPPARRTLSIEAVPARNERFAGTD